MNTERIIAFLDVLGFSALVSREDFGERFESYIEAIRKSIEAVDPKIEYTVFSDSIVILSPSDTEKDLLNIIQVVSQLSYEFLVNQKLPIKGSITKGKVTYNTSGNDSVIAGPPIVEAYKYEQAQNWVGIMISPNTLRCFPDIVAKTEIKGNRITEDDMTTYHDNTCWKYYLQYCYMIPLRGFDPDPDKTFHGLCVMPRSSLSLEPDVVIEDLKSYLESIKSESLYAPDIGAQVKYQNTQLFLRDIITNIENTISKKVYVNVQG